MVIWEFSLWVYRNESKYITHVFLEDECKEKNISEGIWHGGFF